MCTDSTALNEAKPPGAAITLTHPASPAFYRKRQFVNLAKLERENLQLVALVLLASLRQQFLDLLQHSGRRNAFLQKGVNFDQSWIRDFRLA
jgi:hypothetical protein